MSLREDNFQLLHFYSYIRFLWRKAIFKNNIFKYLGHSNTLKYKTWGFRNLTSTADH